MKKCKLLLFDLDGTLLKRILNILNKQIEKLYRIYIRYI